MSWLLNSSGKIFNKSFELRLMPGVAIPAASTLSGTTRFSRTLYPTLMDARLEVGEEDGMWSDM